MTLADDISADAALFLSTDDFSVAATYKPLGAGGGTSVNIIVNESLAPLNALRESQEETREAVISAPSATVSSPQRTDTFTVTSGPQAGTWIVVEPESRDAGIVNLRCRLPTTRNTVAENAHEVRN